MIYHDMKIRCEFDNKIKSNLKVDYLGDIIGYVKKIFSTDDEYMYLILALDKESSVHDDMLFRYENKKIQVKRKCSMYYRSIIPWAIKNGRKHTLSKKDIKWYHDEYLNEN